MASGTPSAQVRVPVGDLVFPPPPTSAHTILLGENYPTAEKLSRGGVKIIRERQRTAGGGIIIPGGRGWSKNLKESAQNRRTVPKIPYSIS